MSGRDRQNGEGICTLFHGAYGLVFDLTEVLGEWLADEWIDCWVVAEFAS